VIAGCEHRLDGLTTIDADSEEARSQPETSLTSDTALAIEALRVSGVGADQPAVAAGIKWLVDHRLQPVRDNNNAREMAALLRAILSLADDLESTSRHLPPDIRVAANRRARGNHRGDALPTRFRAIAEDLCKEVLVRQRFDGGWSPLTGADSRRRRGLIRSSNYSCGETSSPEATGATLEMLIGGRLRPADPAIVRAAAYLCSTQRGDGSWDSTTGARFLHGTTWALRGLLAAGIAHDDPTVAAGVNWLLVHQQACGGWGEAAVHSVGQCDASGAEATAIQTAWAVLTLVAAGQTNHNAVRRGVEFLIASQSDEGNWSDLQLTVRDSPAASWYRSELHSTALPLLALARWAVAIGKLDPVEKPLTLRLIASESPN
jgi:squalene-hopene/tetraprenyl-beta-curcumene cyclase